MLKRYLSNATANVSSGVVVAGNQLIVMGIAVATWEGAEFEAWALAMSIAAIAPILSASLSSVVTRRLVAARYGESSFDESAIVGAGQRIAWAQAGIAFTGLIFAGAFIQSRSGTGSLDLYQFLILLMMLLAMNCWPLLWQVRFGQYFASERNWMPALTNVCARASGVLGMLTVIAFGERNLISVAAGLAFGTWVGLFVAFFTLPGLGRARVSVRPTSQGVRTELRRNLGILSGFAVAAASSLSIVYSVPPLVSMIAPQQFSAFYLAGTLNAVATGVLSAAMAAMLAPFARLHAAGASRAMQRVVLLSPSVCSGVTLVALWICWFGLDLFEDQLSDRSVDVQDIRTFLAFLGLQTIARTSASGLASYVSSAGTARQMSLPLVLEMLIALTVAVPLGWLLGVHALLLGLAVSGLIGSHFVCSAVASLALQTTITPRAASASLLAAQLIGCALWWSVVGGDVLVTD